MTKVSPKFIQNINDDNVILWFNESNKYVVTSDINSKLIQLYTNPDYGRDSFVSYLKEHFQIDSENGNAIYENIADFIEETTYASSESHTTTTFPKVETPSHYPILNYYSFYDKKIRIRYESDIIKSLFHPQIAHHSIDGDQKFDTSFDIFKKSDDLYLLRDGDCVGKFKTESFHFLQGKFALELTNSIHNKNIDQWIATFHASTISNGKESIMIIGDSGNGKSTLSALLMAKGYDILCDDFTPLYENDMLLYRYPAATSIKKGAFDMLQSHLDIEDLITHTNGPKKVNIKYVPPVLKYNSLKSAFPCHHIVYVKYDKDNGNALNKMPKDKILETLIPDSWISPNERHALKFINWFKETNCHKLTYSNNDFALSKFEELFNG
ncbi:hypothetical protein AB9K26_15355 [Psychroserpens sp. XS_ASV72]|uniref:hypothetical protein n=1 Tax=Psychroserpens sp. XS_ASV72 TaxID=3241293 RepID=UPI0035131E82